MAAIHRALNSIPSRPVLVVVPVVVILVLAYYYWSLRSDCTDQANTRAYFEQQVRQAADSNNILKLADFTKFPWQQVKGFTDFKPQHHKRKCPLNWDWPGENRQSIIDDGLLSVLIFVNEGSIADYVEFRDDRISIADFEKGLTPETARFTVKRTGIEEQTFQLTLVP